jgi:hypothetical protein
MECLTDLLNPQSNLSSLVRSGSAQGLYSDMSISTDEGLGLSDIDGASTATTSPELSTPPLSSPVHVSGDRNPSVDSNSASPTMSHSKRPSLEVSLDKYDSQPRLSQLELLDDHNRPFQRKESIPAEEPQRRRSRRRASKLLQIALATSDRSMHVPSLLERYQVCSLACCSNFVSLKPLRHLIMESPRNTEAQNYKLSYEREPQWWCNPQHLPNQIILWCLCVYNFMLL